MAENIKKMEEFKMANTILIKRGLIKNLSNLTLAEGELYSSIITSGKHDYTGFNTSLCFGFRKNSMEL